MVEELRSHGLLLTEEHARDADRGLHQPHAMKLWVFQALLARLLDMQVLVAQQRDNAPGFRARLALLEHLVAAAPWEMNPDMGLLPKTEEASLQLSRHRRSGGWDAIQ